MSIRSDDTFSFGSFYSAHINKLLNYAMGFLKSKEETEEAVQDIFVKFWNNRDKIKNESSYEAYLFNIAHNHLLNCLRKKAKNARRVPIEEARSYPAADNVSAESELILDEQLQLVNTVIGSLSPQKKLIFELKRHHGLTNPQIAEKMDLSVSMVEKHWRQIVQAIKARLEISKHG